MIVISIIVIIIIIIIIIVIIIIVVAQVAVGRAAGAGDLGHLLAVARQLVPRPAGEVLRAQPEEPPEAARQEVHEGVARLLLSEEAPQRPQVSPEAAREPVAVQVAAAQADPLGPLRLRRADPAHERAQTSCLSICLSVCTNNL